jgi:hypothetical protein
LDQLGDRLQVIPVEFGKQWNLLELLGQRIGHTESPYGRYFSTFWRERKRKNDQLPITNDQ